MANIVFPSSPSTGQVFASGSSAWQWDGTAWRVVRNTGTPVELGFNQINFFGSSLQDALFSNGFLNQSLDSTKPYNWTATQTFSGSAVTPAAVFFDVVEKVNVIASAPTTTTNFYVNNGSVQYYTTNATVNWAINIAFSSTSSLNSAMAVGQSITIAIITTQGATAYYNSSVKIDGTTVTPYWQTGVAPASGNTTGIDAYTYTIIKTANATFTVLAAQMGY